MKTAVQWLFNRYVETAGIISTDDLKQALEMEKQQIIEAFDSGDSIGYDNGEDYYKQTCEQNLNTL